MKRDEIIDRVNKVVLAEFDVEEEDLRPEAHFGEDLGLDSLDGIDLVVAIEREFKEVSVKIKEDQARAMRRLSDVYDFVESVARGQSVNS